MQEYIVIPIFSDNLLHPLHKNNHLSLLYVKEAGKESEILTFDHVDAFQIDTFDFLKDKTILTTNKKFLSYVYPFKNVYDINLLNYYIHNKQFDDQSPNSAIEFFYSRFHHVQDINTVIPIFKHQWYCDQISKKIEETWNQKDSINFESYEHYNNDAISSFCSIEKSGIKVTKIFDEKNKRQLSNNKLYSDYFLYTSTGRPSNNFAGTNFAALDKKKKELIIPDNDYLVEYDYDACNLRIIADLIDYKFPKGSAHDHLAELYNVDREEGKLITFKYLYGGIPWDVVQLNPFFSKVKDFIKILWDEFKDKKYIETPIYKRQIFKKNFEDMTDVKLFNYYIQAAETEQNIRTIIQLQRYLYKRQTSLILYVYDAFLIDFKEEDGIKTLKEIKKILEGSKFMIRAKMGYNYSDMKDITNKL